MGRRPPEETGRPPQHRVNSSSHLSISPDRTSSVSPSSRSRSSTIRTPVASKISRRVFFFLPRNDVSIADSHRRLAAPIADVQALRKKMKNKNLKKKKGRKKSKSTSAGIRDVAVPEGYRGGTAREKSKEIERGGVCHVTRTEKTTRSTIRTRTRTAFISLVLSRTLSLSLSL